jgi:hypothetical protein
MKTPPIEANNDPGIWQESVRLLERFDVFIPESKIRDEHRIQCTTLYPYFEFAISTLMCQGVMC